MPLILVFDHHHLKHPRQAQKRRRRDKREPSPAAGRDLPISDLAGVNPLQCMDDPVAEPPDHENPYRQKRQKLYYRLKRDGDDHAVMTLVRVEVSRAEKDGEDHKPQCHVKRRVLHGTCIDKSPFRLGKGGEGEAHRLQLQRDIGRSANDGDKSDNDGQKVRLAIARRDHVRDGGDALCPPDPHQLAQAPPPADHHQRGTKIDGKILKPRPCGKPHSAVKRPRRAIDRK